MTRWDHENTTGRTARVPRTDRSDDVAFCHRVSEALAMGYRLHEGPAVTFNGDRVIVAQAVVWPGAGNATSA